MKNLLSFITILVLFLPVSAQAVYDQHMSKGRGCLKSKDYPCAEEAFRTSLGERPDDYKATLGLGIALSRRGLKEGEGYLKKALLASPDDPEVSYELGLYYYNRAVYAEAKDYFENVVELVPESSFSEESWKYLRSIRRKEKSFLGLDAAAGLQYDSNVLLGPEDGALPEGISGESDWRAVLYLRGRYQRLLTEKFKTSLGYSFYQSLHRRLSDFNISHHAAEMDLHYAVSGNAALKAVYLFEYVFIGGDDYVFSHSVSPSLEISEGRGYYTAVSYKYSKNNFMNAGLFSNNSERTGSNNSAGVTQRMPLGRAIEAKLGYSHDSDSTRKDFWDYKGDKGFLSLQFKLPRNISMSLYGEYYDKDYEGINPSGGIEKHDKIHTYSLSLTKEFLKGHSITAGQIYVRHKSNIDIFDYSRAISSLLLTARF